MKEAYIKGKERARQKAKDWQNDFSNHAYSYAELAEFAAMFRRLGRKYGLLQEFKENGII